MIWTLNSERFDGRVRQLLAGFVSALAHFSCRAGELRNEPQSGRWARPGREEESTGGKDVRRVRRCDERIMGGAGHGFEGKRVPVPVCLLSSNQVSGLRRRCIKNEERIAVDWISLGRCMKLWLKLL